MTKINIIRSDIGEIGITVVVKTFPITMVDISSAKRIWIDFQQKAFYMLIVKIKKFAS